MTRRLRMFAALAALAFTTTALEAQRSPADRAAAARAMDRRFEAAFAAASRGDLSLVEQAIAGERRADVRAVLRARLAAAAYRRGVYREPELVRIAASARDPGLRESALNIMLSSAFADGDYRAAAAAGARLVALPRENGDERAGAERTRQLAELLAASPGQRVKGPVARRTVPLSYDRVGLPRIGVTLNGQAQEAVVDSGANLSVLSAGAAARLGVRIADSAAEVANGVQGTVPVRIGIAERLAIAGTIVRNVPFLIIDDAQLTFPVAGGYSIQAIIGLPVLRALERVRVTGDRFAVEASRPWAAARQNLFASTNDVFVRARIGGRTVPLHLDTGANQSALTGLFAAAHPTLVAGLSTSEQRMASAGGARRDNAAVWREPLLEVGGRAVTLPSVSIVLAGQAAPSRFYGTIGSDALRRFSSYAIDLRAMRLEVGEPVPAASPRAASPPR